MTRQPFFSVIIPMYNSADSIHQCIESVVSQSFTDFEVLVVDDGSVDNGFELAERYAKVDDKIKIFSVPNGGVSYARNIGLESACGTYLVFLDSDDLLPRDALANYYQGIVDNDAPDIILGNASCIDNRGSITGAIPAGYLGLMTIEDALESMTPATKAPLLHYVWNKAYRRALIEEESIRFSSLYSLGEDFLFNCAVFGHASNLSAEASQVYLYRKVSGSSSLTQTFRANELQRRRCMEKALLHLYEKRGLLKKKTQELERMFGQICMVSLSSVGLSDCSLSMADKISYLREFRNSEYRGYVSQYYRSLPSSLLTQRFPMRLFIRGHLRLLAGYFTARGMFRC